MLWKFFGCLAALGISLCLPWSAEWSAVATEASSPPSALADLLTRARQAESDRQWQEAIQVYEKVMRRYPGQADVERRLQIVRVHFDVSRRYTDKTFVAATERTTSTAALELFGEILTKLQLYYVDPVDFQKLLRNGTAFLEVALTEPEFVKHNVSPSLPLDKLEDFRLHVHQAVLGRPANSVMETRQVVQQVALMARDQIGLPPTAVIYEYISGAVGLLDPYSAYLTGGEYQEIMSQIEGNLIGVGVELWAEGDELRIVEVFRGAPSEEAGLLKNDRLLEIGGVRVADIGAKRAADLLRGPENTTVKLVYDRPAVGRRDCQVTRRRVEVPSVSSVSVVDPAAGIAYLRISNFQRTTAAEVDQALRSLYAQGARSLIIDLRRNPGGLLDAAVEIADRFLPTGKIVSTRGRNAQEDRDYSAKMPGSWDIPLMVMIDEDSASASEIFAGAIRDQNRGLVVGRTSYGKGSVQGVFQNELSEGGIRLTISKFFSPAGHAISARGVIPHFFLEESAATPTRVAAKLPVSTAAPGVELPRVALSSALARDNALSEEADSDLQRAIELARIELPKLSSRH
jgi:carboxyl-terminal processing protease